MDFELVLARALVGAIASLLTQGIKHAVAYLGSKEKPVSLKGFAAFLLFAVLALGIAAADAGGFDVPGDWLEVAANYLVPLLAGTGLFAFLKVKK